MAKSPMKLVGASATVDGSVFDVRPISLPGFKLLGRRAVPVGRPTLEEWAGAMQYASETHESSPYWVGDLLAYAEDRQDWKDKLQQAMNVTKLARQTLLNLATVSRHVEEPERQISPSPSHSAVVAPLPRPEQTEWLERARESGWTTRELHQHIRDAKRRKVLEGQADTMHTVEVRVELSLEAQNAWQAEDQAWALVKAAIAGIATAKVTEAKSRRQADETVAV